MQSWMHDVFLLIMLGKTLGKDKPCTRFWSCHKVFREKVRLCVVKIQTFGFNILSLREHGSKCFLAHYKCVIPTHACLGVTTHKAHVIFSGLSKFLEQQGFSTVGYGCTTCIGNSGDLAESVSTAISKNGNDYHELCHLLSQVKIQTCVTKTSSINQVMDKS